ncbi:DUF2070 family protein [Thermogladius sp.]|uniref:DUF2070 family protein n=1 Tax=Thermogladius sp. TaxID=2023064 RepID=UPI003D0E8439
MKLYRPKSVVSKYYTVLFSLPHWKVLAAVIVVFLVAIVLLMGQGSLPFLTYFAVSLLVLYVYSRLSKGTVFWKPKRVLGLSLTALIYVLIYAWLLGSWVVAAVASASLLSVVVLSLDGTKLVRYSIPVVISSIPVPLYTVLTTLKKGLIAYALVGAVVVAALDYVVYRVINRRKIGGYGAADIGTLFLRNWLDRDKSIEEFFESVGSPRDVDLAVLRSGDTLLVYTSLHYGPFSNVGSSLLPEELERTFSENYNVIVFHGFGSHDRDVVSTRELAKLRPHLVKLVNEEGESLLYHGAFEITTSDKWRVLGLVFDKLLLLMVSRPHVGIDDLPYSFNLKLKDLVLRRMNSNLLLVESHNWERAGRVDTSGLGDALAKAVEAAWETRKRDPTWPMVRSISVNVKAPGVVKGVARIVEIRGSDGRDPVLMVFFRGNNMAPGSRDRLLNALEGEYNGLVEVLTNDEHSETGVRAHITYIPVHLTDEAILRLKDGVKRLVSKPFSRGLYMATSTVKLRLLNNAAYELVYLLKKSYLEATVLLLLYVFFLSPLLSRILFTLFPA